MKVLELVEFLYTCDPEAPVLVTYGSMSHVIPSVKGVRKSKANPKRKGEQTRYLEMPETGELDVVILEN